MERVVIRRGRACIKNHNLEGLRYLCKDVVGSSSRVSTISLYKLFLNNVCIYGTQEMVVWLVELFFEYFNEIDRMALRQLFFYSKRLTERNKGIDTAWFDEFVLAAMRV